MKRVIRLVAGDNISTDWNDIVTNIFQIPRGTGSDERTGNRIFIYKIRMKYKIFLTPGLLNNVNIRIILYRVKQNPQGEWFLNNYFQIPGGVGQECLFYPKLEQITNVQTIFDKWEKVHSKTALPEVFLGIPYYVSLGGSTTGEIIYDVNKFINYENATFPQSEGMHLAVVADGNPVNVGIILTQLLKIDLQMEVYFSDNYSEKIMKIMKEKIQ